MKTKFFQNILDSLKANDEGFSVKKELAVLFSLSCVYMSWHIVCKHPEMADTIYISNLSFIGVLLGIGALQTTTEKKIANNQQEELKP